jgi:hypothetical protein
MNSHPTPSSSSHHLEGVFLGVSQANWGQKSLEFSALSRRFLIRPGEQNTSYFSMLYYYINVYSTRRVHGELT